MNRNRFSILVAALVLITVACMCSGSTGTPTAQPAATAAPATAAPEQPQQPASSGIVTQVVMAKDTQGDLKDPVDPTTVFGTKSVIHAVTQVKDAPAGTKFTAEFYVVDVGSAADANSLITSTDVVADGTRNIDFTLTPTTEWPVGSYRVDISVNGQLDTSAGYTVQ